MKWPQVDFISASSRLTLTEYVQAIGDLSLVIDMVVGAAQRMMAYPKFGMAIHQEVSEDAAVGYQRLVDAGFTSRILVDNSDSKNCKAP